MSLVKEYNHKLYFKSAGARLKWLYLAIIPLSLSYDVNIMRPFKSLKVSKMPPFQSDHVRNYQLKNSTFGPNTITPIIC